MKSKLLGARRFWVAIAILWTAAQAVAADAPAPVPASAFFANPTILQASISPTGRHVAINVLGPQGTYQLVVLDTGTLTAKVVFHFNDADVANAQWISEKRLVFTSGNRTEQRNEFVNSDGLWAVDFDGTNMRQVARATWSSNYSMLDPTVRFLTSMWSRDSDSIFVTQARFTSDKRDFSHYELLKVDTRTGARTSINRPGRVVRWLIDSTDTPRIAMTRDKGRTSILHFRGDAWAKVAEFDTYTGQGGFEPFAFGPGTTIYVNRSQNGGPGALYAYDPVKKEFSAEPVLTVAGFDLRASLKYAGGRLVGIDYQSDAWATHWIDPALKETQAKIDQALPATVNLVDVPVRGEVPFVLVRAYSDAEPGQYFLYDMKADKLVRIGRARPEIDPARMAVREFVRYKARDGMEIPAWVTRPRGAKGPLPTVVLVHGGPWVRGGTWAWNADSQFLASRGYAVIEPEFRGSTGYGFSHFKAGWKQWGQAMQADVADGTRWAIDKGIADPKRICIGGGSYGGYATLMGLVRDPDLYRCGFEFAGVTDLELMYTSDWSDASADYKEFGMPVLLGDREADAAMLKENSPLTQAAKIRQPLLLAYGKEDRRVPIDHGTRFRDAVSKGNPNVEWVSYWDEGHGLAHIKNRLDFYTRVEKFLARNLGE